ncbi:helix-turn-helix domain-containing protein [Streptomyces sp. NPDC059096]|uniref:helix-turn-helix domain-containing protein n=1 Tax=Streptomyces sp. NPDC059096 TaxID=3346727 RepID=UPI0036765BD0
MSSTETFADALRRLRGELSQRELARRASCSKTQISDLEGGRRRPRRRLAMSLDRALGANGALVALVTDDRAARATAPERTEGDPSRSQDDLFFGEWDDELRRRRFLLSSGAAGASMITGLDTGGTPQGGQELLAAHRALRAAHGRMDNLRGAAAVYTGAIAHHQDIVTWHGAAQSGPERRQIAQLAADTGGFLGFLTADLGLAAAGVGHYRQAAEYAREAGDLSLCANILGQMSRIYADREQYPKALALAERALHLASTAVHPAVRCWLHAVRAHHHAYLGNGSASQTDLNTAWTLLDRTDDGEIPPYLGYLCPAELGKWTGHAMTRLGENKPSLVREGRIALDDARSSWSAVSIRGSAEVLTATARAYTASGEAEEAAVLLTQALHVATTTGSARNLRAVRQVQALLSGHPQLMRSTQPTPASPQS